MSRPGSLPLQPLYGVTSKARLQVWGLRVGWKPVEETGAKNRMQEDGGNSTVLVHLYCPLDHVESLITDTCTELWLWPGMFEIR